MALFRQKEEAESTPLQSKAVCWYSSQINFTSLVFLLSQVLIQNMDGPRNNLLEAVKLLQTNGQCSAGEIVKLVSDAVSPQHNPTTCHHCSDSSLLPLIKGKAGELSVLVESVQTELLTHSVESCSIAIPDVMLLFNKGKTDWFAGVNNLSLSQQGSLPNINDITLPSCLEEKLWWYCRKVRSVFIAARNKRNLVEALPFNPVFVPEFPKFEKASQEGNIGIWVEEDEVARFSEKAYPNVTDKYGEMVQRKNDEIEGLRDTLKKITQERDTAESTVHSLREEVQHLKHKEAGEESKTADLHKQLQVLGSQKEAAVSQAENLRNTIRHMQVAAGGKDREIEGLRQTIEQFKALAPPQFDVDNPYKKSQDMSKKKARIWNGQSTHSNE